MAETRIETIGAALVGVGVLIAIVELVRRLAARRGGEFTSIRLILARYLALALEFELGADILSTAIAPSWDQIAKLGAIAVIRTALNFFLSLEVKQERRRAPGGGAGHRSLGRSFRAGFPAVACIPTSRPAKLFCDYSGGAANHSSNEMFSPAKCTPPSLPSLS